MKRFLALLIAVLMLVSLTACGEKTTNDETTPANTEAADPAPSGGAVAPTMDITFEELTVVDNDEFTIRITELVPDDTFGYTLKTYIENKTADKTFTFNSDRASVNGVEVSVLMYEDVPAGKNVTSDITIMNDVLEKNGITEYTDIELLFRVHEADIYDEYLFDEKVHVYPYGEENATKYERDLQDSDVVVLDNEYVTVFYTGSARDDLWDNVVNFFIINKSDKDLTLFGDDVSVNDAMLDPIFAPSVQAGNVKFDYMSWSDDELEENHIESIDKIEFVLRGTSADDFYTEDYFTETIVLDLTK